MSVELHYLELSLEASWKEGEKRFLQSKEKFEKSKGWIQIKEKAKKWLILVV